MQVPAFFRTGLGLIVGACLLLAAAPAFAAVDGQPMPEFKFGTVPDAWLNGSPLRAAALRGKVVLIDLFTTG